MIYVKKTVILLSLSALLTSCGVVKESAQSPGTTVEADTADATHTGDTTEVIAETDTISRSHQPVRAMNVSVVNKTKSSLLQAYRDWKGTPYRLGGGSEKGVDCSMFINIVFAEYFDMDLPTNTRTQLNAGEGIRRTAIQTGDLIFFRTGRGMMHVGIMVDQEEFLHASTSEGVTISEVSQKYWTDRYLAARRVL